MTNLAKTLREQDTAPDQLLQRWGPEGIRLYNSLVARGREYAQTDPDHPRAQTWGTRTPYTGRSIPSLNTIMSMTELEDLETQMRLVRLAGVAAGRADSLEDSDAILAILKTVTRRVKSLKRSQQRDQDAQSDFDWD